MADQAVVIATDPTLQVKLVDAGQTWPGLLLAGTTYTPTEGDVVTVLELANATALILGMWSAA